MDHRPRRRAPGGQELGDPLLGAGVVARPPGRILERALAPFAELMPPSLLARLHHALSVVYGIEPYMILKDIWGLPDREVERTALWMADALVDAALREAALRKPAPRKGRA